MSISLIRDMRPDIMVVGAGANGLAIGREAVLSGLSVLVVDKGDIGAGTSSASSRMIHGGLRYLEGFEFPLVRESLRERERLFRNAGHLVKPMPITVPVFRESTRSLATIRAGLLAYDILSFDRSTPRSRMLGVRKTRALLPGLKTAGLKGAVSYVDGQVEQSERLWIAHAKDIARAGGTVATYTELVAMFNEGSRVVSVRLRDVLTSETAEVYPQHVINAAGPWGDFVLARNPAPASRLIGGAKGSHIILPRFAGAPATTIHFETEAGKPLLVIPWRGAMMIASTDQRWGEADPGEAVPDEDEIHLLLSQTNRMFPGAGLCRRDIIDAFSGVRPLPYSTDQDSTKVTRSHFNSDFPGLDNLTTVVGGKITTCRQLGEDAISHYMKRRGRTHRSPTIHAALPGHIPAGDSCAFAANLARRHRLSPDLAVRMTVAFGTEADRIGEAMQALDPALDHDDPLGRYITAVTAFARTEEWARTEDDIYERRLALDYPELRRRRPATWTGSEAAHG